MFHRSGKSFLETRSDRRRPAVARKAQKQRTLLAEFLEDRTVPTVFTVTGTGDTVANDGVTTLREAILSANAQNGFDVIEFDIGTGIKVIQPTSSLPSITSPLWINGRTQGGYADDPLIVINGVNAGAAVTGLTVNADGCILEGLVINGFGGNGVTVNSGVDNLTMQNCWVGLGSNGTSDLGNGGTGLTLLSATDAHIGGTSAASRNVFAGNGGDGIFITGGSGHLIEGNFIGTNAAGNAAVPNDDDGIDITNASGVTVGGANAANENLISGNGSDGIEIFGPSAKNNVVGGNFIGLDVLGINKLSNTNGIHILNGANLNTIGIQGGTTNLISGNTTHGIFIEGATTNGNVVQNNRIGTSLLGLAAQPNGTDGVHISDAFNNTIGGTVAAARNIIAGNTDDGVEIQDTGGDTATGNIVSGNYIGLGNNGTSKIGNSYGVYVNGALNTVIGGDTVAERNVIGANKNDGILIAAGSQGVTIIGNYIGVDSTGAAAAGNGGDGIQANAGGNTIGSNKAGEGNVISGNTEDGIEFVTGANNVIAGNRIGTNAAGTAALANTLSGVHVFSANNTIGGATTAHRNVISGNGLHGVFVENAAATGNQILGNIIGLDVTGSATALGNGSDGIHIENAANNTVGSTTSRNTVSGNSDDGISIVGATATNNNIVANIVGLDVNGSAAFGNNYGIYVNGAPSTTVGTTAVTPANIVSANKHEGILVFSANNSVVEGNYVGTDISGLIDRGNLADGIEVDSSDNVKIGVTTAGGGNIVSGNGAVGVLISNGAGSTIEQNLIGLNKTGTLGIANDTFGIQVTGATNVRVGGTTAASRNVISGNLDDGLQINAATGTLVQGNYLGLNSAGTGALGNGKDGIENLNATGTTIGGTVAGARNVISGNTGDGIDLSGANSKSVSIQGNIIGLDAAGAVDLGNAQNGVNIHGAAHDNTVGGTAAGSRNIISGNNSSGVVLAADAGSNNTVQGNYIGLDLGGTIDLGNSSNGISLLSVGNLIGGTTVSARNVISGNTSDGINVGAAATGNTIQGNYIGTDATGLIDVGNGDDGVQINGSNNTVGGTTAGARNVISGNNFGVFLTGGGNSNGVFGNWIGLDASGSKALGNSSDGVFISSSTANSIGSPVAGSGNVISGNGIGILINSPGTNNLIVRNFIGTDSTGVNAVGNVGAGININASTNSIGDPANVANANTIAFNGGDGVEILGGTGNKIGLNSIFSNSGLGIDLGTNGVLPNDAGDADSGANNLQNYPVLSHSFVTGNTLNVYWSMNGTANAAIHIDFYLNHAADPSGFGEGLQFLSSADVVLNGAGNGGSNFGVAVPGGFGLGDFVTAIATDANGNSSEFSKASTVTATPAIIVTPTNGLSTTESGGQATFTIVLTDVPTDNVTISLTSGDLTEGTVSPAQVVFTPGNALVPQTVTVTGVDDALSDGNIQYTILTGAATSNDPFYNGLNPSDVIVVNNDNEPLPFVTLSRTGSSMFENSGAITVTATLSTPAGQDVIVNLGFDGTATKGTDYNSSANFITITAGNLTGSITLTPVADANAEPVETIGVEITTIVGSASEQTPQRVAGAIVDPGIGLLFTLTQNNDNFTMKPGANQNQFGVVYNGDDLGIFTSNGGAVTVQGLDGFDNITAATGVVTPMSVDGGNGNDFISGGDGNDTLLGGVGSDLLFGQGGNDSILGGSENDSIDAGAGNDTVDGEAGADYIVGGDGADSLLGSIGNDGFDAGAGNDFIDGGQDNDFVYGLGGNDTILGQDGADGIDAGAGDDVVDGGTGNDFMYGLDGNDTLIGGDGNDGMDGGTGDDSMLGGLGNDLLFGNFGNDREFGEAGNDSMDGNGGNDLLDGGADNDLIFASGGGIDIINGGAGDDVLQNIDAQTTILGGDGNDTIYGANFTNDSLVGEAGNDLFYGLSGNDTIVGGAGNDTADGGAGVDLFADFAAGDVFFNGP